MMLDVPHTGASPDPSQDTAGIPFRGSHIRFCKAEGADAMILQCQWGTDELNHGNARYLVNNHTWRVEVPDEVGRAFLDHGKAGVTLVEEPEDESFICPHCGGRVFVKE